MAQATGPSAGTRPTSIERGAVLSGRRYRPWPPSTAWPPCSARPPSSSWPRSAPPRAAVVLGPAPCSARPRSSSWPPSSSWPRSAAPGSPRRRRAGRRARPGRRRRAGRAQRLQALPVVLGRAGAIELAAVLGLDVPPGWLPLAVVASGQEAHAGDRVAVRVVLGRGHHAQIRRCDVGLDASLEVLADASCSTAVEHDTTARLMAARPVRQPRPRDAGRSGCRPARPPWAGRH